MSTSDCIFVAVFGGGVVIALLAIPYFGLLPLLSVLVGLILVAAAGKFVEVRQEKARREWSRRQGSRD